MAPSFFNPASWFKPRPPHAEGLLGRVAPPNLFTVGIGPESALDSQAWRCMFEALRPHGSQLFLESPSGIRPDLPELLEAVDGLGTTYHLGLPLPWPEPRRLVRELQGLRNLDRLRVHVEGFAKRQAEETRNTLRLAASSGQRVWAVLSLEGEEPGDIRTWVEQLHEWGLQGMTFRGLERLAPPQAEIIHAALASAYAQGYPVFLEGCLPMETAPSQAPSACSRIPWACYVDGSARVRRCPHDAEPLGSLLETPLQEIWARVAQEAWPEVVASAGAPISLDEDLRPLVTCWIREGADGGLLVRGYHSVPLTPRGLRVVQACKGQTPLGELQKRFGEEAVSLAFALFSEGLLRFVRPEEAHG